MLEKKRLIITFLLVILLFLLSVDTMALRGRIEILNPSGDVVAKKECDIDTRYQVHETNCSVRYDLCLEIGWYKVNFVVEDESVSADAYYCPSNDTDVLKYMGIYYGCKLEAKNYIDGNEDLLNIKHHLTDDPLISNKDYCFTVADGYYYCSYTERWLEDGKAAMHLSFVPWNTTAQKAECCEINKCYDGSSCVENQANDPTSLYHNGFRCIDGNWVVAKTIYTPDGKTAGYCPAASQCLVNLFGNPDDNNNPAGNPQCIDNGQYIQDDYCENGIWTSRTKLIALRLLDLPSSDYILFCGDYDDTLNHLSYTVEDNNLAKDYVVDKTNNYCILSFDNKVIFGTSLNEDISYSKFTDVLDADCSGATTEDGDYHQCSNNKAWYNKKLKSIVYSKDGINLGVSWTDKFIEFLKNPFDNLINKLASMVTAPYDQSFVKGVKKFKNLYINKKGSKSILGTIEGTQLNNLVIEYKNFDTDICEIVDAYNEYHSGTMSGILCSKEDNNYYVLAQGGTFTTLDPKNIWADLTSKLKIN